MTLAETEDNQSFIHQDTKYQPARSWRTWLIGRPLAHRRRAAPDHRQSRRPGRLRFRCHLLDGLRHAGDPGHPGAAGNGGLGLVFPISIAIVVLLVIVTLSYEQTIHAYPGGGGAYIVARDNLGELPGADSRGGAADRLRPDGGRLDLVGGCPDRLGVPGAASVSRGISVALVSLSC